MRRMYILMLTLLLTACGQSSPVVQQPTAPPTSGPAATSTPPQAPSPAAPQGDGDAIVVAARDALGAQLAGIPMLELQSKEATTWSDGSLGCPDPATSYIQVITPGFRITFSDGARTFVVHTTDDGKPMIWCENGSPKVLAAVR